MAKRARRLKISLATKCQILFGAAVLLIIAAALYVPWLRIERLMEQLDQSSAETVAKQAVDQHIARYGDATKPTAIRPTRSSALPPTTAPVQVDGRHYVPSRLLLIIDPSDADNLTRPERGAIRRLRDEGKPAFDARYVEDGTRYRYTRLDASCVRCHAPPDVPVMAATLPAATRLAPIGDDDPSTRTTSAPATASSTAPSEWAANSTSQPAPRSREVPPHIFGAVAVEIASQVQPSQLMLNRIFIIAAGLLAGTLAIITFYLITTKLILQPVRVLQETAEKVSGGDLNIRSDINTGDEFQQLSDTFNIMLANLKESDGQLRAVNKNLDVRLGQLAESNVALYESNRLKNEFLANVSHELRTPLNSILGFAELLRESTANSAARDAKVQRYLQNILSSGNNLLDLINDLLDLAKIEAGKMEVRSEPISLVDLFEGLLSVLKPLTEGKQIAISPAVQPDVPIISTDPSKLQQVLYNLMSNAIKFSPAGEKIELTATLQGGGTRVRIGVHDNGPGIDPADHVLIFEKFRQLDAGVTRQHGGTGLGLAISRELAALLGGTIDVESQRGQGATFWVTLPLAIEPGARDLTQKLITA